MLDAASEQFKKLLDELLPQVRLSALENELESRVDVTMWFVFEEDATTLTTEGRVNFPAKVTETETITV